MVTVQGARHAFAESAGRNMANPTAILLCAANMLSHLGLQRHADVVQNAVKATVKAGKVGHFRLYCLSSHRAYLHVYYYITPQLFLRWDAEILDESS